MKYLIKESKFNDTIKNYILSEFDMVHDVYITTKSVMLGASEGFPVIEKNVINIIIDNSEGKLKYRELIDITKNIGDSVEVFFKLNVSKYSSKWEFNFGQLGIVSIHSELLNQIR